MLKNTTNDPLSDDGSINFILKSFCHNLEKESARNIEYLIRSFCNTPEEERNFVASLQINDLKTFEDLLIRLTELQRERIKRLLDLSKKTIAIYLPSCAYREHLGDIANKLRKNGHNAFTLIGTVCDDKYEKEKNVFYAGHGIVNYMDFVDVFLCPTFAHDLPVNSKKVYFLHDLQIGPVSNIDAVINMILEYDYFVIASHYQVDGMKNEIGLAKERFVENKDKGICLVKGGYIKLDRNIKYFNEHKKDSKVLIHATTVIDSTFENVVCLPLFSDKIINAILNNFPDYKLIFRPHPHTVNTSYVHDIVEKYKNHPLFTFDDNASFYMENYSKSALMITDMSGTAYTYAFTTLRPVIFFSHNENGVSRKFHNHRYFEDRDKIGYVVENVEEMVEKIKLLLTKMGDFSNKVEAYRDSLVYNIGKAEDYFVNNLEYIIEGKRHRDWVYL